MLILHFFFPPLAIITLFKHNDSVVTMLHTIIIYRNQLTWQYYFEIPKVFEYSQKFPLFPQNSQYSQWKFTTLKIPGNFASLSESTSMLQVYQQELLHN